MIESDEIEDTTMQSVQIEEELKEAATVPMTVNSNNTEESNELQNKENVDAEMENVEITDDQTGPIPKWKLWMRVS